MKKSRLLLIPLVGVAAGLGVLLSNTNNVEAANNQTCSSDYFKSLMENNISVTVSSGGVNVTNNTGINLKYTFFADGSNRGSGANLDAGDTASLGATSGGYIELVLNQDLKDPCIASTDDVLGRVEFNTDGLIDNPLYNDTICVNYRNRWGNDQIMKNAVPYCYSPQTYSTYSVDQVQTWINTAESLYSSASSPDDSEFEVDKSYKRVEDVTKIDPLVCDAFSNNNYETMHKYSYKKVTTEGDCKTTCQEKIEVNFSDPVEVQAGLCFEYLIEIKSKVECKSKYKAAPPTRKTVCYPTPVCIGIGKSGTQISTDAGGPNEDFDACVLSCDGGEYSQKCIDKCYNKVYKNKKSTKKVSNENKLTKDELKALSPLVALNDSFYEAVKVNNKCSLYSIESIRAGLISAEDLYNYRQQDPGGYYSAAGWTRSSSDDTDSCPSDLGPYYFRSLDQTVKTIAMIQGTYKYNQSNLYYNAIAGILMAVHADGTYCTDYCYWSGSCGTDTVLTEAQAQAEYEKELEEYMKAKAACEQSSKSCNTATTEYEIIVDNADNDNDTKDDKETFSSYQKLNSNKVQGDFPDMVTLTSGKCEGNEDGWWYHNIITFPGTWINNKTGQSIHTMDPGYEDFYTAVGHEFCTKINSVPVNTAWYYWKVNQEGNPDALTDKEKQEIEENIDMNIHGKIENYGQFGWDFDIECFYAIGEPEQDPPSPSDPDPDPSDPPGDGDGEGSSESPVNDYEFRSIALDNLFPNSVTPTSSIDNSKDIIASNLINEVESLRNNNVTTIADPDTRELGFNWTCGATNLENPDYIVQPVSLINDIQLLGDSIYDGDYYLDYHIRLTPETMNIVRKYNKDNGNNYAAPTDVKKGGISTAGVDKTAGVTVYKSYLLHNEIRSSLLKSGLIGCNNEEDGECKNTIDTSTSCYNEYMAESAVLKGVE